MTRWSLARQIDEEYIEDEDPFDLGQFPTVEYTDEALRILSEPEREE